MLLSIVWMNFVVFCCFVLRVDFLFVLFSCEIVYCMLNCSCLFFFVYVFM